MRRRACVGPCAMRAAVSHALVHFASSGVTACMRCGAWATKRPRRLLRQCPGVAHTYATRQVRKRIRMGLHPIEKLERRSHAGETPSNLRAAQIGCKSWSRSLKVRRPIEASGQDNGARCGNGRNRQSSQSMVRSAAASGLNKDAEPRRNRQFIMRAASGSSHPGAILAEAASRAWPRATPPRTAHS